MDYLDESADLDIEELLEETSEKEQKRLRTELERLEDSWSGAMRSTKILSTNWNPSWTGTKTVLKICTSREEDEKGNENN